MYDGQNWYFLYDCVFCLFGVFRPTREYCSHLETSPLPNRFKIWAILGNPWSLSSEGSLACHSYSVTDFQMPIYIYNKNKNIKKAQSWFYCTSEGTCFVTPTHPPAKKATWLGIKLEYIECILYIWWGYLIRYSKERSIHPTQPQPLPPFLPLLKNLRSSPNLNLHLRKTRRSINSINSCGCAVLSY